MNKMFFAKGVLLLNLLIVVSCTKQLDLSPISSISDSNYWKTPDQFDAFVAGIHTKFRDHNSAFQLLGEMRADIFGTDPPNSGVFTGEATQGFERLWTQTLDLDNTQVNNFGGFYSNIVQINLLLEKLNSTTVVDADKKACYLGIAYGMRAYYYFQLYRSWGNAVIITNSVGSIDPSNLAKAASSQEEVLALIKSDITNSESSFGTNYTFNKTKYYWSKAATLMLKAEVYLWGANRSGGATDATAAQNALKDITTNVSGLALQSSFAAIFSASNRSNSEIIFSSRYQNNEAAMSFISNFIPQASILKNYYDSTANRQFNVGADNWPGILRAPIKITAFRQFNNLDSRKWASIQPAYNKVGGIYTMAGCFANKFQGEQVSGSRIMTDDFPIYRYADLLLLMAETKVILGQDPSVEINAVRARAFGTKYIPSMHAFPNQPNDANPKDAILRERYFEFVLEGKRWHDLRRMGDAYVYQYTALKASDAYKLLWPIDRASLTNNLLLKQNPGYASY